MTNLLFDKLLDNCIVNLISEDYLVVNIFLPRKYSD